MAKNTPENMASALRVLRRQVTLLRGQMRAVMAAIDPDSDDSDE